MAITSTSQTRVNQTTVVTVVSDLSAPIYYHWYIDGAWVGSSIVPRWTFQLEDSDQVRIDVNDTNDPDYDPVANAPEGYPSRRTLVWYRTDAPSVVRYIVEYNRESAGWVTLGIVPRDGERWLYSFLTPRLDDLTSYEFRVTAVKADGTTITPIAVAAETLVRSPDPPSFAIAFDEGTTYITFSAA